MMRQIRIESIRDLTEFVSGYYGALKHDISQESLKYSHKSAQEYTLQLENQVFDAKPLSLVNSEAKPLSPVNMLRKSTKKDKQSLQTIFTSPTAKKLIFPIIHPISLPSAPMPVFKVKFVPYQSPSLTQYTKKPNFSIPTQSRDLQSKILTTHPDIADSLKSESEKGYHPTIACSLKDLNRDSNIEKLVRFL